MTVKKLIQTAIAVLCLVNLNVFAVQHLSAMSASELMQLKPGEMSKDDHYAYQAEMQNRSVNMNTKEKKEFRIQENKPTGREWNSNLQPYIDAHREFEAHS